MSSENSRERYLELARKWLDGSISPEEAGEYAAWYNAGQDKEVEIPEGFAANEKELRDRMLLKAIGRSAAQKVVPVYRRVIQIAVAAAIVLLLGGGAYILFVHKATAPAPVVAQLHDKAAPVVNRATITLSNGQKVFLDSIRTGTLVRQSGVSLVKLADGKIVYNGQSEKTIYNTLVNPRGSKIVDVTLADGSKVWLNAGSQLVYPVAFNGKERPVELDGEAYFEVAPHAGMPFMVKKGDKVIRVLGTHFNINAYDDEPAMTVTLLEGSVKVQGILLKPNDQATITPSDVTVMHEADVEAAMAWKNGYFDFKSMAIDAVMRQIGRWYDLGVVFEGKKPEGHFTAMLNRDVNASAVLQGLAYTGIHYRIDGNSVIITQQ